MQLSNNDIVHSCSLYLERFDDVHWKKIDFRAVLDSWCAAANIDGNLFSDFRRLPVRLETSLS